jgi:hypothetical protein
LRNPLVIQILSFSLSPIFVPLFQKNFDKMGNTFCSCFAVKQSDSDSESIKRETFKLCAVHVRLPRNMSIKEQDQHEDATRDLAEEINTVLS